MSARSRAGLAALAKRLPGAMSAEQLAHGIIEIANWNQANAIRQMTIQRGIDPRGFALLTFGGAGPAQSPAVMELLGMKACIVPPNPGNLSAFGLLAVDWRTDHIVTKVMHEDAIDLAAIAALYAGAGAGRGRYAASATASIRRASGIVREADIRYAGQSMEVRVPAPAGAVDASFLSGLIDAFHAAHLRTFGYNYAGQQKVELVNFCVSGFGLIERPQLPQARGARRRDAGAQVDAPGLFRRRISRHAGLRPRGAAARLPARRAGGGGGVRLHHGGVPRAVSRRRSARHPDRAPRAQRSTLPRCGWRVARSATA